MSEAQPGSPQADERAGSAPSPAQLLQAALEKVVFFEWRLGELAAELAGAQERAAASERERARAVQAERTASAEAQQARSRAAELEADRARLASLLARPSPAPSGEERAALEAERARSQQLAARVGELERDLSRKQEERERWLTEMIAQAKAGGESPSALAEFIAELRGEVLALRERQKRCDALLAQAGIEPPPAAEPFVAKIHEPEPEPVALARQLWAEGRLTSEPVGQAQPPREAAPHAVAQATNRPAAPVRETAALALAERCLQALNSTDARQRAQAARHLAAVPTPAAGPALAHALGLERDPKARAEVARALTACGGEGALTLVEALLAPEEPPVVRMAALDALVAAGGPRGQSALRLAARDPAPALRRRAAALAYGTFDAELLAQLARDPEAKVRAATELERLQAAQPPDARAPAPAPSSPPSAAAALPTAPTEPPAAQGQPEAFDQLSEPQLAAVHAVRAAIFGLTEDELANALGVPSAEGAHLANSLLQAGRLRRRGKRLIAVAAGGA